MVTLLQTHQRDIETLCQRYAVKRLSVFGSAAQSVDFTDSSDIDLLVEFEDMEPGPKAKAYFGLWFGLEDLLNRTIDLAEPSAIKNPYVAKTVTEDLTPFYAAA